MRSRHMDLLAGALACVPFAILYFRGVQRSIGSGDSADLVIAAYTLGIPHPTGYPLYTWLGKLFSLLPFGGVALRVTLMSPVFAVGTLFLLFRITMTEIGRVRPGRSVAYAGGVAAVALLGGSRPFWHSAEIAEVYTLNAFCVTAVVWLYMGWLRTGSMKHLYLSSLALGISLGTHMSNASLVPLFLGLTVLVEKRLKPLVTCAALWFAGASQYLYLLIRASRTLTYLNPQARFFERLPWTGTDSALRNWLWFITGARWHEASMTTPSEALAKLHNLGGWILRGYEVPGLVLFGLGVPIYLVLGRKRRQGILFLGVMALQFIYYLAYRQSLPGMILPFFGLWSPITDSRIKVFPLPVGPRRK